MLWLIVIFLILLGGFIGRILLQSELVIGFSFYFVIIIILFYIVSHGSNISCIDTDKMNKGIEGFIEQNKGK